MPIGYEPTGEHKLADRLLDKLQDHMDVVKRYMELATASAVENIIRVHQNLEETAEDARDSEEDRDLLAFCLVGVIQYLDSNLEPRHWKLFREFLDE